jgi:hypothetical protein
MPRRSVVAAQARTRSGFAELLGLVDSVVEEAQTAGREDLALHAEGSRTTLNRACTVMVVGEFKKGKSSALNALLGVDVSPVSADAVHARTMVVRFSPTPTVTAVTSAGTSIELDVAAGDAPFSAAVASLDAFDDVEVIHVGVPADVLRDGVVFVDAPPVEGPDSALSAPTLARLPLVDAVLFVSDASQEYTEPEMQVLRRIRAGGCMVVPVVTKTDFYVAWQRVVGINETHLDREGLEERVLPVSATLYRRALERGDDSLRIDSGLPGLRTALDQDVLIPRKRQVARVVATESLEVVRHLACTCRARAEALSATDAEQDAAEPSMVRVAEQAKKLSSGDWTRRLASGLAEIRESVDDNLIKALRSVNEAVTSSLGERDPALAWEEFELSLEGQAAKAILDATAEATAEVRRLAQEVVAVFVETEAALAESIGLAYASDDTAVLSTERCAAVNLDIAVGQYSLERPADWLSAGTGSMVDRVRRRAASRDVTARRDQAAALAKSFLSVASADGSRHIQTTISRLAAEVERSLDARAARMQVLTAEIVGSAAVQPKQRGGAVRKLHATAKRLDTLAAALETFASATADLR